MKVQFLVLLSFVFFLFNCNKEDDDSIQIRTDCIPSNLQNGIIAFYPFDNGSLADESGNGNDLTNPTTAVPAVDRDSNPNCAFQFNNLNGIEEYLTTGATNFLNGLSAFSVALWYHPIDTSRAPGDFEVLISRGDTLRCPNRNGEWSIGLYDCRRAVFGHNNRIWANRVAHGSSCQGEINAVSNKWQHVVAIYNNNTYEFYFNGVLQGSESGLSACNNLHIAQDIGDLFIGKHFTGIIDDIIIYNRALSTAEVLALSELGGCCN